MYLRLVPGAVCPCTPDLGVCSIQPLSHMGGAVAQHVPHSRHVWAHWLGCLLLSAARCPAAALVVLGCVLSLVAALPGLLLHSVPMLLSSLLQGVCVGVSKCFSNIYYS